MPWLDSIPNCPLCGESHLLCHHGLEAPSVNAIYEYQCPKTEKTAEIGPDFLLKEMVQVIPRKSVELKGPIRIVSP